MTVQVEKSGPVTTLILNRPESRNAVDRPTALALADAFREFETDANARVAVLWGAGGTFCSGADLKAFGTDTANRLDKDGDGPMGPTRMPLNKPVIAAISGYAVAGGLELALWCDLRVMEEDAIMGVFCRRFGVPLIDGGTVRLPRLIGLSRSLDLILTGRPVNAEEAHRIGLTNRVVKPGLGRRTAEELAAQIAAFPQACMLADRASAYRNGHTPIDEALRDEFANSVAVAHDEGLAGAQRFRDGEGRHGGF